MEITYKHTSLAPMALSLEEMENAISSFSVMAQGIGIVLARQKAEQLAEGNDDPGFDSSNGWDFEGMEHLLNLAEADTRHFAKTNNRFYNAELLNQAIAQNLIEHYAHGFEHP